MPHRLCVAAHEGGVVDAHDDLGIGSRWPRRGRAAGLGVTAGGVSDEGVEEVGLGGFAAPLLAGAAEDAVGGLRRAAMIRGPSAVVPRLRAARLLRGPCGCAGSGSCGCACGWPRGQDRRRRRCGRTRRQAQPTQPAPGLVQEPLLGARGPPRQRPQLLWLEQLELALAHGLVGAGCLAGVAGSTSDRGAGFSAGGAGLGGQPVLRGAVALPRQVPASSTRPMAKVLSVAASRSMLAASPLTQLASEATMSWASNPDTTVPSRWRICGELGGGGLVEHLFARLLMG